MPVVFVSREEPVEKAIRRLSKLVSKEGIIQTVKQKRYYEKPSVKKRRMKNRPPRKTF